MRTTESYSRNDYKTARRRAGLTQERWAESIGCSVDSVRGYESGTQTPCDEIVLAMCEISGLTSLAYWHMRHKSILAEKTLPEVEQLPLPQAVVQLLCAIGEFQKSQTDLLALAADGKITDAEEWDWQRIIERLDAVIRAAIQVKVAEGGA